MKNSALNADWETIAKKRTLFPSSSTERREKGEKKDRKRVSGHEHRTSCTRIQVASSERGRGPIHKGSTLLAKGWLGANPHDCYLLLLKQSILLLNHLFTGSLRDDALLPVCRLTQRPTTRPITKEADERNKIVPCHWGGERSGRRGGALIEYSKGGVGGSPVATHAGGRSIKLKGRGVE
ncbi:hypothetical protein CEXT_387301 [Caerostris extrusa]|uniref:Uncharacterized protein n=1 Tax=Caerostris extrusa TaxID=172846 RepID=A0AAV4REF6_CAEEX|nr:hypothetical protein CEXT_387301 [Caerostris extrusa]